MNETKESLGKLRVVDLKQRLSELGLPLNGLKADLVARLYQHLLQEHEASLASQEVEEEDSNSPEERQNEPEQQQQQEEEEEEEEQEEEQQPEPSDSPSPDTLMEEKIRQQQLLLQEQKNSRQQEDLYRLQQQALIEKQQEEKAKQAHLLRLQQEALKQNEDEQKQLQALGLKPPSAGDATGGTSDPIPSVVGQQHTPTPSNQAPPPPPPIMVASQPPKAAPAPPPPSMVPSSSPPGLGKPVQPPRPMGRSPAAAQGPSRPEEGRTGGPVRPTRSSSVEEPARQPQRQQSTDGKPPPPLMSLQVTAPKEDAPDVRLPQALEEALAFKQERAKQLGVPLEEGDEEEEMSEDEEKGEEEGTPVNGAERRERTETQMEFSPWASRAVESKQQFPHPTSQNGQKDSNHEPEAMMESEGEEPSEQHEELSIIAEETVKRDNRQKRKKKKKKKKGAAGAGQKSWIQKQIEEERLRKEEILKKKKQSQLPQKEEKVEVSYVQEDIVLDYSDPMHKYFASVFENFKITEAVTPMEDVLKKDEKSESASMPINLGDLKKVPKLAEDAQDDSDHEEDDKPKISKRKLKLMKRMSIAELKQTVFRPDVVEMHDVTAKNPKLLVNLKAARNTVPVPRHWCFKRKYLQGKRGIEKPPFELPDFIKRTGIMEMRAALQEKEDQKTLKAKMRDKVRPKMGKIDIDYQKLHDAFFKWQCKPEMTIHGDLYYEGKEFETKMKDKKPGEMSDDLRIALGMPVGANAHKVPPPWLIAMQRYGPPPSYPNLKIPGLNAPIPEGCSFGYHAGGWGKPPVDNMGKPIYGDVFGTQSKESDIPMVEEEVEKSLWGELESESEEESEEEESEEEEEETAGGMMGGPGDTGLVTPSGMSSLPAGLETPDMIELRKKHMETEMEGGDTPALYTILPEKRMDAGAVGRAMMGSSHTYDLSSAMGGSRQGANQGVDVALDPSELDLVDTDAMAARYEATLREQNAGEDEDFSDMVAEHAAKQRNKRRRLQQQDQNKPTKKYKDFKF